MWSVMWQALINMTQRLKQKTQSHIGRINWRHMWFRLVLWQTCGLFFRKGCFSLWLREKEREVAFPPCYLRCAERLSAKGEKSSSYFPWELNFMLGPTAEWHLWRGALGGQHNRGTKYKVLDSEKPCVILSLGHRGANFYCFPLNGLVCFLWSS